MNKKSSRKQSLQSIIMRPMLIVHVIIVVIFISTINTFDIIGKLRGGEVDNLARAVTLRGKQVEQRLLSLGATATSISGQIEEVLTKLQVNLDDPLTDDQAQEVLALSMPILGDALRQKEATGAFVFLDTSVLHPERGGFAGGQSSAVYLLDEAITTIGSNADDLMMLVGPKELARDPILPLDSYWAPELSLSIFSDTGFILQPFQAAQDNPQLSTQRLCLWSRPVRMNGNREALMVTVPLRYGGEVLGVVGMELSVDRLRSLLQTVELHDGESSFYALGSSDYENAADSFFVSIGSFATRYMQSGGQQNTTARLPEYGENVIEMRFGDQATATGVMHSFNLYYQDSPFRGDRWALVGGIENGVIFGSTGNLITILIVAFVAAIAIALIFAYVMALYLERPLRQLSLQLTHADIDIQNVHLEHTDIREIDRLIDSIESLSSALAESGRRTIRAIEMTGMPIGFVECDSERGEVFMTDLAFTLLDLRQEPGVNTISQGEWEEISRRLMRHPEGNEPGVYHLQSSDIVRPRYLRVRIATDQNRSFGILMDVTEEIISRRQLEHERDTDPLTGLLNRKAFLQYAHRAIQRNPGKVGIMLFADLDNLKYVNDTYGHDMGDRYIQSAAKMFGTMSSQGGVVSRISGDEFAIFLYGYETIEPLQKVLLNLVGAMGGGESYGVMLPDGSLFKLRYSMGYAWYPGDSAELETLLRYADYAMYEIKRTSKGSVRQFSLQSYIENSFLIEKNEAFNQVVEQNLVRYAFQPIVDVYTGGVFGYEALMRPDTPEFPSPYHLLRMAQSQAKLYQIERMTLFNVFRWISEHEEKIRGLMIFVNTISDHMLSPKDLVQLEDQYGHAFRHVVMEVSEGAKSAGPATREKLSLLRRLGCGIAVDDYGTGYSGEETEGLSHPDFLKVDMTLVQKIETNENKQNILRAIVDYAKRSGIKVIAEGVETRAELQTVIRLGVDYVQGFYVGMPEFELRRVPETLTHELREMTLGTRDRRRLRD